MSETQHIWESEKLADASGRHRLLLNFIEIAHPEAEGQGKFYDFHSLVWESGNSEERVISKADFEKGCERRRWVSELHSINSAGIAVLKVGEESVRSQSGRVRVVYSWREWDLARNKEVRLIRICETPFEPLDLPNFSAPAPKPPKP